MKKVKALEDQIAELKTDNELLHKENKKAEQEYQRLANQKEFAVKSMTEKLIGLESLKDLDLKHYTTSMKHIEEEARAKLHDLHASIASKNSEVQILCAQLALKNEEITHLMNEMNHLRE